MYISLITYTTSIITPFLLTAWKYFRGEQSFLLLCRQQQGACPSWALTGLCVSPPPATEKHLISNSIRTALSRVTSRTRRHP